MNSFVCSFIHSFFLSFIDSLIHCWRYALMGCLMDSLTRCIHWIVHSCVRTLVFRCCMVSFIRSVRSFIHSVMHACMHSVSRTCIAHSSVHVCSFHFVGISCPSSLPSFIQPSLISHMHIHKTKKQHHMRRTCKHSLYVCTYTQTYLPTNLHAGLAACMHAAACIRLPDLRII